MRWFLGVFCLVQTILMVPSFAQQTCANRFRIVDENLMKAKSINLRRALQMYDVVKGLKAAELLHGNQSRLASYILSQIRTAAREAVGLTQKVETIAQLDAAAKFAFNVETFLEAAVKNQTSQHAAIIQQFLDIMKREDRVRENNRISEILDRPVSSELHKYLDLLSQQSEKTMNRVLEKWIQVRYQLKKYYGYFEVDDATLFVLTNIAVKMGDANQVVRIYGHSRHEVLKKFGRLSDGLFPILLFNEMHKYLLIEPGKAVELYQEIKKDLGPQDIKALPSP